MMKKQQYQEYSPVPSLDLMRMGIIIFFVFLVGAGMVALMVYAQFSLSDRSAKLESQVILTEIELSLDDEERLANELYQKSHAMPEVLATTMSAFPTLAKECDMRDVDAKSIDWTLSCEPNGGEVQVALLERLQTLLSDPNTEIKCYSYAGTATRLVPLLPEDGEINPITVDIAEETVKLEETEVLMVKIAYDDGNTEVGYFDTTYNYARLIFDESEAKIAASVQSSLR